MRLLTCKEGKLVVTPNREEIPGPYAILSHTWAAQEEEVIFEDLEDPQRAREKAGYRKIEFCLERAQTDGLDYIWIDSCCIDKRNSSELGEAINRMFRYYAEATVCYVYMADVYELGGFVHSRWHERGWTLQELIAPKNLQFYSNGGRLLGDRTSLSAEILQACGVDIVESLDKILIPDRFRWSLRRETLKAEDTSWCMLGLLDVTMPISYGIGAEAAREELLRVVGREHGEKTIRQIRAMLQELAQQRPVIKNLLEQLKFLGIGSRRTEISLPQGTTCNWLLQHPAYKGWLSNAGFLWIKGKPGAGKSTLIRFADSCCDELKYTRLSFYFNARGGHIEKTSQGLFRDLLSQLLRMDPAVYTATVRHWTSMSLPDTEAWTLPTLHRLLAYAAKRLSRPVACYIDALDECSASELQDTVDFLVELSAEATKPFMICFASRYYPSVIIPDSVELRLELESHHDQAIADYVSARLKVEPGDSSNVLKSNIVAKANRVFFWVILVVKILNQEVADGNVYLLQHRLDQLPGELSQLFSRIVDQQHSSSEIFRAAIHWLLFCAQPLSPTEYYFAILSSQFRDHILHWKQEGPRRSLCLCSHNEPVQHKELEKLAPVSLTNFVSSSSKGLAEIASSRKDPHAEMVRRDALGDESGETYRVQFIHGTVREFFLDHGALQQINVEITADLGSWIHNNIKDICQRYLFASPFCEQHENPLLPYMHSRIVHHAERAAAHIAQDDFVLAYSHWRQHLSGPTIEDLPCYDTTYLIDFVGCSATRLVETAHRLGHDLNAPQYAVPIIRAIGEYKYTVLRTLIRCGADLEVRDGIGRTPLVLLCEHCGRGSLYTRLENLLDQPRSTRVINWNEKDRTRLAHSRVIAIVDSLNDLLRSGADVNATDRYRETALMKLCREFPSPMLVQALLQSGAHADKVNFMGKTARDMLLQHQQYSNFTKSREVNISLFYLMPDGLDSRLHSLSRSDVHQMVTASIEESTRLLDSWVQQV